MLSFPAAIVRMARTSVRHSAVAFMADSLCCCNITIAFNHHCSSLAAQPNQATASAEAPPAFRDATAPDVKRVCAEAPVPGAALETAEAARAGPDLAAAAPTGGASEKLVEEAEQQLAQLRLGAGHSSEAANASRPEQQQAAEGPHLEGAAAAVLAGSVEGAEHTAGQAECGQSKPARGSSLAKKVFAIPCHQLWLLCKASGQDQICVCGIKSVLTSVALGSVDADLSWLSCYCAAGQQWTRCQSTKHDGCDFPGSLTHTDVNTITGLV